MTCILVLLPGASPRPPPLKLRRGSPKRPRREGGRTPPPTPARPAPSCPRPQTTEFTARTAAASRNVATTTSDSRTLTAVRVKGRMWRATPLDPKRGRRLDRQKIWSVSSPALMPDCEPRANIDNNEQSQRLDNEHSEDDAGDCDAIHDGSLRSFNQARESPSHQRSASAWASAVPGSARRDHRGLGFRRSLCLAQLRLRFPGRQKSGRESGTHKC